jgi:UDP-glucose 4-epimerase|tara:strand:- start:12927 stop:13853 length:927 start_codon:yes stop_codon:yes gene_type:complete
MNNKKQILITGVAGFIGSHVSKRFIHEGYEVIGVDDLSSGRIKNIPTDVMFVEGDLSEKQVINKIPTGCSKILHLAGQSCGEIGFDNPIGDLEKNTISTLNLIQYGIDNNVERFVYSSSMSVYGNVDDMPVPEYSSCGPLSCYGVGKLAAEGYLKVYQSQLPYVSLRMYNVYGPGQDMSNLRQGMVSIFLSQALKDGNIHVKGSVDRFRDFIYIDDTVEAWYRAATHQSALCKTLNVGTGHKTTVGELLEKICYLVDGSDYYVEGNTPGDQPGIYADNSLLKRSLNMEKFISIDDGLAMFVDWAKGIE